MFKSMLYAIRWRTSNCKMKKMLMHCKIAFADKRRATAITMYVNVAEFRVVDKQENKTKSKQYCRVAVCHVWVHVS